MSYYTRGESISPRKALVGLLIFVAIVLVGISMGVDQTIAFVVASACAFGTFVVHM